MCGFDTFYLDSLVEIPVLALGIYTIDFKGLNLQHLFEFLIFTTNGSITSGTNKNPIPSSPYSF
jgi:hypothetical protein